ncbi:AraC family transcriptional regulator [Halalkalibacter kiskunsagensis]|uniref:AraC family transcriptional regulator n=1 Tax=Halalkalibacter kiskunsagensis TaxID=1548599 RepID=A0ABV6KAU1_9BACI
MSTNERSYYETIGFRTHDQAAETLVDVQVVGREIVTSPAYQWDGLKRGENESFIFQYTISGEGAIDIKGNTYQLKEGQAFMVKVPDEHCYYFPPESSEWEFIFLTLKGQAASACWEKVTSQLGHIVTIPRDSRLMTHVFMIYQQAYDKDLIDQYYASARAYEFIMECYRYFKQFKSKDNLPDRVIRAREFIDTYYYRNALTIEDIANAAGLSKYYLIKRFKETIHMTPIQYLTKVRLEQAIQLLRYTDVTIKEIAIQVGYANDNYFNKVFRKVVGMSPGEFRNNKHSIPFDRLVIQ